MKRNTQILTLFWLLMAAMTASAQSDSIVLKDVSWDANAPADMNELFIPSGGSTVAGFIYRAGGAQKQDRKSVV